MASRDLSDAEPALVAEYQRIKAIFEAAFPSYELRPTCTYRSPAEQKAEFDAGRSAIDGVSKLGEHNYHPSRAIDVGVFTKNNTLTAGSYLDDLVEAARARGDARYARVTNDLRNSLYWNLGQLAQRAGLRWGGDWRDEEIPYKHNPIDPYHIEIREATA